MSPTSERGELLGAKPVSSARDECPGFRTYASDSYIVIFGRTCLGGRLVAAPARELEHVDGARLALQWCRRRDCASSQHGSNMTTIVLLSTLLACPPSVNSAFPRFLFCREDGSFPRRYVNIGGSTASYYTISELDAVRRRCALVAAVCG